jgi:hypothetical protein
MLMWARWLLLGVLLLAGARAHAETVDWINPAGGDFEDGENWSTGQVPGAGDVARLALEASYTVTVAQELQLHGMVFSGGNVTLNMGGHDVRLGEFFDGSGLSIGGAVTLRNGAVIMGWGDVTITGAPFQMHNATISDKGSRGGRSSLTVLGGSAQMSNASITTRTVRLSGGLTLVNSGFGGEIVVLQACDISGGWAGGSEITRVTGPARLRDGMVLNPFTGVLTIAGDVDAESGALLRNVSRIEAGTTTVEGAMVSGASPSMGVVEAGRLELLSGSGCTGSLYMTENGALRVGAGASGPEVLEYYGGPGVRLEVVFDGAASPAFEPLLLAPWATTLGGTLRVEVLNPNALRVGDAADLFDSVGASVVGEFATVEVAELNGGRAMGVEVVPPGVRIAVVVGGNPCWGPDFDGDGVTGTDGDIEAFFACLAGDCCALCGSVDFNSDGDTGTDADIEGFFRVLSGGPC